MSRATFSAASSSIAGTTCEYRSSVKATELWPRRSCTTFGWTPVSVPGLFRLSGGAPNECQGRTFTKLVVVRAQTP